MQIVVRNGTMTEAEQDYYVRHITAKYPMGAIDKLVLMMDSGRIVLDIQGEFVDAHYTLHRFPELRKMGGYCAGEPADWNPAKQAELRDTLPNPVE